MGSLSHMEHASLPAQPAHSHPVIDPALLPLPTSVDTDLTDGPTIAKAQGYIATEKVAGSRHTSKQRPLPEEPLKRKYTSDTEEPMEKSNKRGRPNGAGNYSSKDITALLDFTESELPLGQRGWSSVHQKFTKWARSNGRPERIAKSLEAKFKQASF